MLLRRYIALLLAAALLVTGHSATASRFDRDAAGQVILCTGSGPVTVYVDENGVPTGAPHICPDCITHLLDLVQSAPMLQAPVRTARQAPRLAPRAQPDTSLRHHARARAPPMA